MSNKKISGKKKAKVTEVKPKVKVVSQSEEKEKESELEEEIEEASEELMSSGIRVLEQSLPIQQQNIPQINISEPEKVESEEAVRYWTRSNSERSEDERMRGYETAQMQTANISAIQMEMDRRALRPIGLQSNTEIDIERPLNPLVNAEENHPGYPDTEEERKYKYHAIKEKKTDTDIY